MKTKSIFLFLIAWLCVSIAAHAQYVIRGVIQDAQSKQALAAANVQISGTYRGTIANEDGFFVLLIRQPEAELIVSFIGYESQSLKVSSVDRGKDLTILLQPIILQGETITVIAEDPGMRIMREVIRRKPQWRDKLDTYRANAYSRVVLENDSGIVSLAESTSETFWDKQRGNREVIKTKEQSSNLEENLNIAFASYIPNLYDDDIEIAGYRMIGPTHPDAFDYYEYELQDIAYIDDQKVFWIRVLPISKLQPTFQGKVAVLDSAYALLEAELIPSESVRFPVPVQSWEIYYTQQFRNYGQQYWLPVDLRMHGSLKIGITGFQFPQITYRRIASLSDYQVNVDLPDSLYEEQEFLTIDSIALSKTEHIRAIPLSQSEDNAYAQLDSTMTLEKAFKPTGFLADLVIDESESGDENESQGVFSVLSPWAWFNRVDGLHAGFEIDEVLFENLSVQLCAAYKTGLERGGYKLGLRYSTGKTVRWRVGAAYESNTDLRYRSPTYSRLLASALPLFAIDDYFDYLWNESVRLEISSRIRDWRSTILLGFNYATHKSLPEQTNFNLLWSDHKQRSNPRIDEGILRTVSITYRYGSEFVPLGVVGQKRILVQIEHALSGAFDFTRYTVNADWRLTTFLSRRLLPNVFDLHLVLQTSDGTLPIQRFGIIDAAWYPFAPFSTLKTQLGRPYEGEKVAALFWEHNFRTVPFELIGADFLVDNGIGLIIHGAHGRTWINSRRLRELQYNLIYTDQFHHELGLSINGLFSLIRMDFTQRIDRPGFYIGLGMNRFF